MGWSHHFFFSFLVHSTHNIHSSSCSVSNEWYFNSSEININVHAWVLLCLLAFSLVLTHSLSMLMNMMTNKLAEKIAMPFFESTHKDRTEWVKQSEKMKRIRKRINTHTQREREKNFWNTHKNLPNYRFALAHLVRFYISIIHKQHLTWSIWAEKSTK